MNWKILCTVALLLSSINGSSQAFNAAILEQIKQASLTSHSDALIIMQDGKMICEDLSPKGEKPN